MILTEQHLLNFDFSGYLLISNLFSRDETLRLAEEARRVLTEAGSVRSPMKQESPRLHNILSSNGAVAAPVDGRLSLHVEHVFRHSPIFHGLIQDKRLTQIAAAITGTPLRLLDDQLYWKPASVGGSTYVHRDSDFFGPLQMVTVWLPLCDVTEDNGCLWAIPGSHRLDVSPNGLRRRTEPPAGVSSDQRPFDFFYEVDWEEAGFVSLPMHAGDVLVLHRHVVHCSLDVRCPEERLSYLVEYFAAEDFARYRESCAGLFDYDERWRFMEPIQSPLTRQTP
jgi:phytanoyl-CoA hydroxylase